MGLPPNENASLPATPLPANQVGAPPGLAAQLAAQSGNVNSALLGTIQSGGLDQIANLTTGAGLDQQALGLDRGALLQHQGLLGQRSALDQQLLELQLKGLGLTDEQARLAASQQQYAVNSSATARGAVNTAGHGQQLSDIATQLANQLAQTKNQGDIFGNQRQQAAIGRFGTVSQGIDIASQLAGLGVKGQQIQNDLTGRTQGIGNQTSQNILGTLSNQINSGQGLSQDILNAYGPLLNDPNFVASLNAGTKPAIG
jgi:hypothetical protein